jgi:hypothetical protein
MEPVAHPVTPAWRTRARKLLTRILPLTPHAPRQTRTMAWADMKPIDFEGEDTSLTEADLDLLK